MTAEIAIMNKQGVALAADSAGTLSVPLRNGGEHKKIRNNSNKLYSLSKHQPVGIMVYGSAIFMDYPWEIIIKEYRNRLGKNNFQRISEYASDFIGFLESFIPTDEQVKNFKQELYAWFGFIVDNINKAVEKIGCVSEQEVLSIVKEHIQNYYNYLIEQPPVPNIPDNFSDEIIEQHKSELDRIIQKVFQNLPIDDESKRLLNIMPGLIASKAILPNPNTGIVIAGYGDAEILPALVSFSTSGVMNNRLKYIEEYNIKISFAHDAYVIPFAQQEVIKTFVEGIHPDFENFYVDYFVKILYAYSEALVTSFPGLSDEEKTKLLELFKDQSNHLIEEFTKEKDRYKTQDHINPIITAIRYLEKEDLAFIAETLINLTSFKRKVSLDEETVGGPVDVALISKRDGFIWIKRKHYFNPELNHQFFRNYFQADHQGDS
jgi:hypothetical protein